LSEEFGRIRGGNWDWMLQRPTINVGIHRGHNSAVALLKNGDIIFHIENERLSRIKYDNFPFNALFKIKDFTDYIDDFCVAGLCELVLNVEPFAAGQDIYSIFISQLNNSFNERGFSVSDLGRYHHQMHASCAFYNSGFEEAICIVKDGAGSGHSFNNGNFSGREISSVFSCKYPAEFEVIEKHVGYPISPFPNKNNEPNLTTQDLKMYSTEKIKIEDTLSPAAVFEFTSVAFGFHSLDAGKVMGMATYGKEDLSLPPIYKDGKLNKEIFILEPGEIAKLPERLSFQEKANLAFTLQKVSQENVKKYIHDIIDKTKCKNICLSGGFFLNCVANYEYLDGLPEDVNLYIDPISSDAGTSIGAAKFIWHSNHGDTTIRKQNTIYYGPEPDYNNVKDKLNKNESISKVNYEDIISLILKKNPVALYQGRSEAGARALGNRSIIYDPRDKDGKDVVNRIKKREWFRPFAGTVLHERANEWFDMRGLEESPYMLYALNVRKEKINEIPAITHVDDTCRVQTLKQSHNLHFYNLIKLFYEQTGVPILFNTSFNLAGDPIVETLDDALYALRNSNLDYLYLPEIKSMIHASKEFKFGE